MCLFNSEFCAPGDVLIMDKVTGCAKLNSEFEFCALECIMLMDKVTGCAKLYSEFGISVSASRTLSKIDLL